MKEGWLGVTLGRQGDYCPFLAPATAAAAALAAVVPRIAGPVGYHAAGHLDHSYQLHAQEG